LTTHSSCDISFFIHKSGRNGWKIWEKLKISEKIEFLKISNLRLIEKKSSAFVGSFHGKKEIQ